MFRLCQALSLFNFLSACSESNNAKADSDGNAITDNLDVFPNPQDATASESLSGITVPFLGDTDQACHNNCVFSAIDIQHNIVAV
ncbi:MAG: hypothetical protein HRU20_24015 [Pseudomonadales bacterium]|nr:hypothetical protein [Pseudomonadales bacterium]